jgi:hypothetical protein
MIFAALDPGSRSSSLAIAEKPPDGGAPAFGTFRPLFSTTLTMGRRVDLPTPITTTRTYTDKITGETKTRQWTQTWRWESSPAERREKARELFALILAHGVNELVVEHNPRIFAEGTGGSQIATNLRDAAGMVESLATLCDQAGIPVHYLPRPSWASRVAGKSHATDIEVRDAVGRYLDPELPDDHPGQPKNEHEIDALGTWLGWLLPPLKARKLAARRIRKRDPNAPARVRRPRVPGEKRYKPTDPSYQRHLAKMREKDEARHAQRRLQAGLPAERVTEPGKGPPQVCKRCGGPRKGHLRGAPCPPRGDRSSPPESAKKST